MSAFDLAQSSTDTDYNSSDEDIPLPRNKMHIKKAYIDTLSVIRAIQTKRKLLKAQEQVKREEKRLLKKLMQNYRISPKTCSIPQPLVMYNTSSSLQKLKPKHKVQYSLRDIKNNCFINISIDPNRENRYFLSIKLAFKEMKLIMTKYMHIIPLDLFQYVARLVLEKKIFKLVETIDEKLKHKGLWGLYRKCYPVEGDEEFVKKTLCAIWHGEFNDPIKSGEMQDHLAQVKERDGNKSISLDDITQTSGAWEISITKEKDEIELVEELIEYDKKNDDKEDTKKDVEDMKKRC